MDNQHQLTTEQEQLLRQQAIDDRHPGPILHDFQAVLDFVGLAGVPAAGAKNLLPIREMAELDSRLSHPFPSVFQKQRQSVQYHPYLQGLNLLLRATGLVRVDGLGAKARLLLDPSVLGVWNDLNATERYFNLLEAWLLLSQPEMVGDERWRWGDWAVLKCRQTLEHLPSTGKTFDLERLQQSRYLYGIGTSFHHLALMELFGLMKVEQPETPTQPWCPSHVERAPFGSAVTNLLTKHMDLTDYADQMENLKGTGEFGQWQPFFKPYFPEWRNNLVLPRVERREGVFVFKVSLGDIWRCIAIPSDLTLNWLAAAILDSVNFDDDHLYQFTYTDRFGARVAVNHWYMEEDPPFVDKVPVGMIPLQLGQSMIFLFDFGDQWEFDVKLERIDPPRPHMKKPKVLQKHGRAPRQYPRYDW
jgi:Plasmid pRiA4b ORF-3-like protein